MSNINVGGKYFTITIAGRDPYEADEYVATTAVKITTIDQSEDSPYLTSLVKVEGIRRQYNPKYGDDKLCQCGHSYYRHFDSYEDMAPVGCKYCGCSEFVPADDGAGTTIETVKEKPKCDVCGKEADEVVVVSSIFGPFSVACCPDCIASAKERYKDMVAYIACAGHFPNDINKEYQQEVRRQLELHGISEEQFINDVDDYLRMEEEFFKQMEESDTSWDK
jgi:hypothetical protein